MILSIYFYGVDFGILPVGWDRQVLVGGSRYLFIFETLQELARQSIPVSEEVIKKPEDITFCLV